MFQDDPATAAILMMVIGGNAEEKAAEFIKEYEEAGRGVHRRSDGSSGKRMGHAGAIISGGAGTAADKVAALEAVGVVVAESPRWNFAFKRAIERRKN
ncbi:MAG: hypothetical protein U0903_08630 [Planctomycetales bacterium]